MNKKADRHIKSISERRTEKRKKDIQEAGENKKQKNIFDCFKKSVEKSSEISKKADGKICSILFIKYFYNSQNVNFR